MALRPFNSRSKVLQSPPTKSLLRVAWLRNIRRVIEIERNSNEENERTSNNMKHTIK